MGRKRTLAAHMRTEQAIALRAQGLTYEQIALKVGYSGRQSAQKAVERALARNVADRVDELRREELLMLDTLTRQCWTLYDEAKEAGQSVLPIIDRLLALSDRRCRLMGLYPRPDTRGTAIVLVQEVKT